MRSILINPYNRTIEEIGISGSLEDIYRTLSCVEHEVTVVTIASLPQVGEALYVDDEGLLLPGRKVFDIWGHQLAGCGLILGVDDEGSTVDTELPFQTVQTMVTWTELVT